MSIWWNWKAVQWQPAQVTIVLINMQWIHRTTARTMMMVWKCRRYLKANSGMSKDQEGNASFHIRKFFIDYRWMKIYFWCTFEPADDIEGLRVSHSNDIVTTYRHGVLSLLCFLFRFISLVFSFLRQQPLSYFGEKESLQKLKLLSNLLEGSLEFLIVHWVFHNFTLNSYRHFALNFSVFTNENI